VGNSLRADEDVDAEKIIETILAYPSAGFISYNHEVMSEAEDRMAKLLVFKNYRFGLPSTKENTLTIELDGVSSEFKEPLVTIGRDEGNMVQLEGTSISRRHCVLVNYSGDVWLYDLGRFGVTVDGSLVSRKMYLDGVHTLAIGSVSLRISSNADLLV